MIFGGSFLLAHVVNYFLFLKGGSYKKILIRYEKEFKISKISGRIILIIIVMALVYGVF